MCNGTTPVNIDLRGSGGPSAMTAAAAGPKLGVLIYFDSQGSFRGRDNITRIRGALVHNSLMVIASHAVLIS